jgi:chemotaxis protein MotB
VSPAYLGAEGYGEHRPVAPNDTDENKAKNRRIEIVLVPLDR